MTTVGAGVPEARTVGRYSIMREIGRGGMASVYLARQLDLDRLVALKELRGFQDFDVSIGRRFLREAQLAGSLNHPNIVTVHEYFEAHGVPHIAMEYLPLGSLRRHAGRLGLAQVGGILEGVLAGLGHAERHQIIHRDVKPENVLITAEGGVKIADFGIAKASYTVGQQTQLTERGSTVGTPSYIAPEQAMAGALGPWTDLYSVGITAFELFAGRTPFGDSEQPMAIVLRQINEPPPRLTEIVPGMDPWIADWVAWLVAKDPAARPQSAGDAWTSFEEALLRLLGPRWRRDAQLAGDTETFATLGRPAAAASSTAWDDPQLAATVPPPAVEPPVPPRPVAPRRRRRLPVALLASLAGLALLLLGMSGRLGSGGSRAGATAQDNSAATLPGTGVGMTATTTATASRPPPQGGRQRPTGTASPRVAAAPLAAQRTEATRLAQAYEKAAAGASATGPQAALRTALRRTAQAYRTAAAAAARRDRAGYSAALAAAAAGRQAVQTELARLPRTTTTTSGAPAGPPSPCAGDSTSDDPSDDACGGN